MRRWTVLSACGLTAGLIAGLTAAEPPAADKAAPPRGDLLERLQGSADLPKSAETVPLRDAVELFNERYGLAIRIDSLAFDQDKGVKAVEDAPVRLPPGA